MGHQNQWLRYGRKYYPQDGHSAVPFIAEYDAIRFIFEDHPFRPNRQDYDADNTGLATRLTSHFARVSQELGYTVHPPEASIDELGLYFVSQKLWVSAESLFKLNLTNYPRSPHVYASLGDYYVARQDTAEAIAHFQKALSLQERVATRRKLTDLQSKATPASSTADKPLK